MSLKLFAPLAAALAVAACTNTAPPRLSASDPRNDGIAKTCTPTNPDSSKPGPYAATIAMTNDGWCGAFVSDGGKPFLLGLVRQRPANGRVEINRVENSTRVEYHPAGATGTETFTVALRPNSGGADVPMTVTVNLAQGERPAVAPAAAPATRPAATTRRTTTRRPATSTTR